jgi:pheromone shutdown protein TraB
MEELEKQPPKGNLGSTLKWGIPILIVVLIIAGFYIFGIEAAKEMVKTWVIANMLCAGVGAALAFAHPVTIITAAVASPITSLNPMIGAGFVAGAVQIFISKPKVRDFESLPDDITSIKGFWKNKITKILLVVAFTNLGSSAGAIYSFFVLGSKVKIIAVTGVIILIVITSIASLFSKKSIQK